jgi:erythromycin esterase-like protein
MELIGDRHIVLIGEATHGTREFYQQRAALTRRLIVEQQFNIVAVEADWPDAYRVNCFVRGLSDDHDAEEALSDFKRFPTWMWRNDVVVEFVQWLRQHNERKSSDRQRCGFYGVDLYSLYASMASVLAYLDTVDAEAAARARYRYSCFEHFGEDSQAYGYAATIGASPDCEEEAVNQLVELQRQAASFLSRDGAKAMDAYFFAEQNARLVKNGEEYYRAMFRGGTLSWNLRDKHMAETIDELIAYYREQMLTPKVVVWEHNSHLGDARYTESGQRGQLNVGQLVRERYGDDARLIGFSTYSGTVTAADNWDEPPRRKRVREGLPESYEALFHRSGAGDFYLCFPGGGEVVEALRRPRLQRAIGVIYRPETERLSHYYYAQLPDQFDANIHIDVTRAVEPLDRNVEWQAEDAVPETFPSGL